MYISTTLTRAAGGWRYNILGPNETITRCFSTEPRKTVEEKINKSISRLNADYQKAKGNYKAFTLPPKSEPVP